MNSPPSDSLFIGDLALGEGMGEPDVKAVFAQYGEVTQCKLLPEKPGMKRCALVRYSSVDEATSVKELLHGFIPQGLAEPITCRFANAQGGGKGGPQPGFAPYGNGAAPAAGGKGGPPQGMGGMGGGKGGGKSCSEQGAPPASGHSMDDICRALDNSGALPGGKTFTNDEGCLFVGNLPADCTDYHLYRMFSSFGPISPQGIRSMCHPGTQQCKGFGFINYLVPASAQVAIQTMNGMLMPDGRSLKVTLKNDRT